MLLTITTEHRPATDLGYLLHKNPARCQEATLAFGRAHLFYPEAREDRCTFALLLDLDPVALVRGKGGPESGLLDQYVNDRPYAASSFLSVAMAASLRTALTGRCDQRPELAQQAIPLEAVVTPLPVRGEAALVERLFGPLGYEIETTPIPLDGTWPQWGASPYVTLRLKARCRLADLLNHLYVLIPVLDLQKHYFIGPDEIEKLLARGEGWLSTHPDRELIVRRYLRRKRSLAAEAIARLAENDAPEDEEEAGTEAAGGEAPELPKDAEEERLEKPIRLNELRLQAVMEALTASGAARVADLGCGGGKLLKRLMAEKQFQEILGVDIGIRSLEIAARRLRLDTLGERQRARIKLIQGALTYRDTRIEGFDAVALVEVIEHIDPERLPSVERVLFEFAKPGVAAVTTPNREYNAKFEGLPPGTLRHADHRFEWTRAEFEAWANAAASRFGYTVRFAPIGQLDPELGAPTQMAIFERGAQ
jgi:3' terminal RNA ribose 2'-O-methyltransferase Hen1